MQLQQLKYFKTIGEFENISQASKVLLVSQPSLSNMIRRLEDELGVKLLIRKGRNVVLSEHGKILFKYAVSITEELEELQRELRDYSETSDRRVQIASPNSIYINTWLSEFLISHPKYTVDHQIYKKDVMEKLLFSGALDFAFSTSPLNNKDFESKHLMSDWHVLLVPKGHPFSKKDGIYLAEAADENFLALSVSEQYSRAIDRLSLLAGFEPKIVFEGETSLLERLCASGIGCFIHMKSATNEIDLDRIDEIRLKDAFARIDLYICWRKRKTFSPACETFKEYVITWHSSFNNDMPE